MIRRHYVRGIFTEGLEVSTDGNTLTIQPGRMRLPDGGVMREVVLQEAHTFAFEPQEQDTHVLMGFDRLRRFFVEWPRPGKEPTVEQRYGILTHLVYFDLPAGTTDLQDVIINVVRGR